MKLPGGRAPKKLDFNRFPLRRSVPDLKPYDVMVVKETGPKVRSREFQLFTAVEK